MGQAGSARPRHFELRDRGRRLLSQLLLVLLRTSLIAYGPACTIKLPLTLCEAACGVTIAARLLALSTEL